MNNEQRTIDIEYRIYFLKQDNKKLFSNKVIYEGGNLQRFHNCLLSEASYYCFSSHNGCYARILDLHQQHIPSYVICDEVGITDFYIFGNQVSRHPKIQYSSFPHSNIICTLFRQRYPFFIFFRYI